MTASSIEGSGDPGELECIEVEEADGAGEAVAPPGTVATVWSDIVMAAHRRLREGRSGGGRAPR
ncbi:hypothetical protein [Streptomyces gibsoniae]|uniref:Uncharacterized protein n=1 Tax=Streptomyces gibsoniae TaxID=3075529 RepID=A0ABU2U9D7_9ACTN|nr:hypothetical protein [Streptomyces sp. DSM 41699]MDT0469572.1 hypothetical protein [Streptomyces sp. DSM 41699]